VTPSPIDPRHPRYALEGRVVTVNAAFDVLDRGRVYVDGTRIAGVAAVGAPPPAGMEDVPVVRVGGTIYPGLIELHNHLSYNALPLWKLTEKFENRGIWGGRPEYRQLVSRPAALLGRTEGLVQAVVRYVEVKCLVAGVTTTQGISLASNAGIRRFYRGIVRNVEQTDDPDLREASTRIADVAAGDAISFLEQLNRERSLLLLHLSEGVDDTARRHFQRLQTPSGDWAITETLGGIHCCGLRDDDYATLASNGGSMVWSPFSNLMLYGRTSDFARARREGVLMALGPDWSPTGSKNLLAELKIARLLSEEAGGVVAARDIVAMATIDAARMLKWQDALGSIQPGKRADLIVVDDMTGDPYEHLIEARETSITFVVIDGTPRYGAPRLMSPFSDELETLRLGGTSRALNLRQETADPIVGAVSLAAATAQLEDALKRLPDLATARPASIGARAASATAEGERWFLDLDHERMDGTMVRLKTPLGLGMPVAEIGAVALANDLPLIPLELDPLSIADDAGFARRIAQQPNLPDRVKRELPRMYGH
jgi:5-methylthioadenosine/S-adenosylhomocysteine deaminase